MQWLQLQNELDHHLGNTGYAGKQRKWQQEDKRLAHQGLESPYDKFCGWLGPFIHDRSKLTESGDVNFYSQSTLEVAQRALRESNEDSNGEKENDALTKAMQTKEQRCCVHGVLSKLTWKECFLEHISMYRKQKMTLTPHVDVEELKRQLRREILGGMKPILEAQGIQFPDIGGVMSDEERRSSFASTTAGGRPQGEHQALASGLIEGHEQPLSSIKLDTIDNLDQRTTCNLILLVG
jgi:hypothetical protein